MSAIDRRQLLRAGALLGGCALARPVAALVPRCGARRLRSLVVIELEGGNDGLSTVVPYADDAYRAARSTTRHEPDAVLRLDERRGLHPALTRLRALWDGGQIALVEGVGYPRPSRSHFKSLEVWHTARAAGRASGPGWIGRLVTLAEAPDGPWTGARCAGSVVHLGRHAPYSITRADGAAIVLDSPAAYRWLGAGAAPVDPAREPAASDPELDGRALLLRAMRGVMADARASSTVLREAIAAHEPAVAYPREAFAARLADLAALVHADLGLRVLSVALGGFDTHAGQRARHDALMVQLDGALGAFLADLATSEAGRATAVLVYSEFGRRLAENGSGGTDHGQAGTLLLLGAPVRGGWYGSPPSLVDLDQGDPAFTTDFRSVLAGLVEAGFGLDSEPVLGARYPALPVLAGGTESGQSHHDFGRGLRVRGVSSWGGRAQ